MKVKSLTVKNIGIIADAKIELNQPLILFYGEIKQGKSTLLNAVRWVFGGSFPSDIIRHGEAEAMICLELDNGSVTRSFYIGKDGSTKARAIVFTQNGVQVSNPVKEIEKFLNPFLLNQNYLVDMSELERKRYFTSLFAVDTLAWDQNIAKVDIDAQLYRVKLKTYGAIDLTPAPEPPNTDVLGAARKSIIDGHLEKQKSASATIQSIRDVYTKRAQQVNAENCERAKHNALVDAYHNTLAIELKDVAKLEAELTELRQKIATDEAWLEKNTITPLEPPPPQPDTSAHEAILMQQAPVEEIDRQLAEAHEKKAAWDRYQREVAKAAERDSDEKTLRELESQKRSCQAKKIALLKKLAGEIGIESLEFDETGDFSYEGTSASMLSTSQLMKLSAVLSSKYPPGFGIDLIDRGESLGKSIFQFIDRAKREDKTILAAIVGEKPATVPEGVGVFVVDNGTVKA